LTIAMSKARGELARLTKNPLPYDLDRNLTPELERLRRRIEEAQEKLDRLAKENEFSNEDLEQALASALESLEEAQEELEKQAMQPLEKLAQLFPLLADQEKFALIYCRQKDLAVRLSSLRGVDGQDDP